MSYSTKRLILTGIIPLILLVLLGDQWLKIWIKSTMELYEGRELIDGIFQLQYVENPGMAFGWMLPGTSGKLALSIFRVLAVVGIAFYMRRLMKEGAHKGLVLCVALIMAGALGNIIDSLIYGLLFDSGMYYDPAIGDYQPYLGISKMDGSGYAPMLMGNVVDMLYFSATFPDWLPDSLFGIEIAGKRIFPPVFNIADSAITFGVLIIVVRQKSFFKRNKKEEGGSTGTSQESDSETNTPSQSESEAEEGDKIA